MKEYVAAGQMVVGRTRPVSLEAVLGSCVGVTLADTAANVGGLIHLLLPEPIGQQPEFRPTLFAETGLPVFVQALLEAGAEKERLQACIAGGALVGDVSELDLLLDVGGRTAEVARSILKMGGIPVTTSETGGYLGCRLSLDMETWEAAIDPTLSFSPQQPEPIVPLTPEEVGRSIEQVRPIPQVALKIIRMLNGGVYRWGEVAEEMRREQVIVARLLHLCNTPMVGLMRKIESVDRAVLLLGERQLLQLTISAALEGVFEGREKGYSLVRGGLYRHSVGTAILAERLAVLSGVCPPDQAYTAGLLHDIGKACLDQHVARVRPLFYHRADRLGVKVIEIEQELLGHTHTDIGVRLAESWGLYDALTEAISLHHRPLEATVNPKLTGLVYLADLMMSRFHGGLDLELMNAEALPDVLDRLGLEAGRFPEIVSLVPQTIL